MRLDAAVAQGTDRLRAQSESPRLDAELLLCQSIDVARSYLYGHPDDELDEHALARFEALLLRREAGEPLAYIAGTREFWSRELLVTPATLIPRPETELLVSLALAVTPADKNSAILDLGTGSGAIAIAIASERPQSQVTATDRSKAALDVARENARQEGLANVAFLEGDWLTPAAGQRFDLIVSNPPYVREDDPALRALQYEPREALASGPDGLKDLRALAAASRAFLNTDGWLMLEHGMDQGNDVSALLQAHGWSEIATHNDLAGLPRVTVGRRSDT